jgi:hypothetical protein
MLGLDCSGMKWQLVSFVLLTYLMLEDSTAMKVMITVIREVDSGKSATILKDLKAYRLVDPMTIMDCPDNDALLQCTYADLLILNILEVDTAVLNTCQESSHSIWPERAPPLDGVMVCCDVSRKDSFSKVEAILCL